MLHFCNILMLFQIMVFVMSVDQLCAVVLSRVTEQKSERDFVSLTRLS